MNLQIGVANMPINLILLTNGTLAFVRTDNFKALFDMSPSPDGVGAAFYEDSFEIGGEGFAYNTTYAYKEIPAMGQWLRQQEIKL